MGLTVKGSPISRSQQRVAETALAEAKKLKAGSIASVALIYAAMGESSLGDDAGTYSSGGVWQDGSSPNTRDIANEARAFLQGDYGFGNGGAIALARRSSDPVAIANAVENNGVYEASGGNATTFVPGTADSYGHEWPGGTSEGIGEAKAIVAAYGGNTLKGGVAGASSGASGTIPDGSKNTTYAFSISGVQNPDEDYWTGINRLAQDVNWYLFSSGEYLYYMDGEEMLAQKPALHLDRVRDAGRFDDNQGTLTYDNTSYSYVSDHKRRFRPQRRTKVAMAQSPTEGTFQLICGIDEVLGGDVIELSGFGLADGRWIVGECRRSVFDVYSELTLVPAIAPITEVAAAGATGTASKDPNIATGTTNIVGSHGTLAKVAELAVRAAKLQSQNHCYTYTQGAGRTNNGNGVLSPPYTFDCSGFVEACYKYAGLGDPAGSTGYAGTSFNIGGPGPRSTACVQVDPTNAVPGDCVVFPNHVVVYLGAGKCVSMGGSGDPIVTTVSAEAGVNNRGITGYFHLRGAS